MTTNRFLADPQWRDTFAQLRSLMREASDLEGRVLDGAASEAEWTAAWAEYAGIIGRIGFLQQRLLSRRVALLPD